MKNFLAQYWDPYLNIFSTVSTEHDNGKLEPG